MNNQALVFTCPNLSDAASSDDLVIQFMNADPLLLLDIYNSTVPPGRRNPLYDHSITSEDLAALENQILLPDPGPYPVHADGISNPEYQNRQAAYAYQKAAYTLQERSGAEIKAKLISMIPESARDRILPPPQESMLLTPHATYRIIKSHFLKATPITLAYIQREITQCFVYISTHSFDIHANKHMKLNRHLSTLNFAATQPTQVLIFKATLQSSADAEIFSAAIDHFDINHPDPSTHGLQELISICRTALPKLAAKHEITNNPSYAANAAAHQWQPTRPKTTHAAPLTPTPLSSSQKWCWTHGPGHSSDRCRFPDPKHQRSATITNKMGSKH